MKLPRLASVAATFTALVGLVLGGAGTAAAQEAAATSYVALGDSYSSGVGAGNYDSNSGSCKRSYNAYPVLWKNANSPSSFHFTACSGATTTDVINNQLGPLNTGTTLVSISVGGNDAGFSDVMTACVTQGEKACLARVAEARRYVSDVLPARLDAVYNAIRSKAPNARVVVLNYPRFYKLNGYCSVGLSETSRAAINDAADHLSDTTAKRVANHG
ncbi:MAG TPA: SGNH/GDSL hydrolase family protein, partial [Streptomyces sp.]|nr:SGNH/GDSL hydrolase family protein [Streptomyces sp.]